jgi:hypothetical protein
LCERSAFVRHSEWVRSESDQLGVLVYRPLTTYLSYDDGKALAAMASEYISTHGLQDQTVQDYFGSDESLASTVPSIFSSIASENGDNLTMTCDADPENLCSGNSNTVAYTRSRSECPPDEDCQYDAVIFPCPLYYERPATSELCGYESSGDRGSVFVHEMSHALGHTKDRRYLPSFQMN